MTEFLQDLAYGIITAAVPVLTFYLVKYLSTLFSKIVTDTESSIINDTINSALSLILSVVTSTSQTYVDSLKASGSFTEEAQKEAFTRTKETVLKLLSEESKLLIESLYSDLDEWVNVQIESAVKTLKYNK